MVAARWHLGYNTRPPKDNGEENGHCKAKIQRRQGQETGSEKTRAGQEKGARNEACSEETRSARAQAGKKTGRESCDESIEIGVEAGGREQIARAGGSGEIGNIF